MTTPAARPKVHREVVSFVRRSTRMNASQSHAWAAYRDAWVVDVAGGEATTAVAPQPPLRLEELYGRAAPLIVEIGSGTGDSLVPMAAERPEANFLAFEVFAPAVASTLSRINRAGIGNVRILLADATQGLARLLAPESVEEIWVFFPDPWQKARHHKRRLVSKAFADLAASRLRPGGLLRLATDWESYAESMREVLEAHPRFENPHAGWAPRFEARPLTKFETRGVTAGRAIRDLTYRRLG